MLEINTDRLTIRRFCHKDGEELFRLVSDPEVMRYLEPPYTKNQAERLLEEAGLCEPPLIYAVEDGEKRFVGYVIYHTYGADGMEIGWVLKKSAWHKGYADELTGALMKDAEHRADYVVIECVPAQKASGRIALKNGFFYESREEGCDIYKYTFHVPKPNCKTTSAGQNSRGTLPGQGLKN